MNSLLVLFFGICIILTNATETLLPDDSNQQNSDFKLLEYSNVSLNEDPYKLAYYVSDCFKTAKSYALTNIATLQTELNKVTDESITNILSSSTNNLKNIDNIVIDAKSKLGAASKNKNCSEIYLPQLEVFKMKGEVEIQICVDDAAIKTANTKGTVQEGISVIQIELAKINDVISKCIKLFWPYETLNCILTDIRQVGVNALGKIYNTYEVLEESSGEFYEIVENAKACFSQNEANVKVISAQIDECLK